MAFRKSRFFRAAASAVAAAVLCLATMTMTAGAAQTAARAYAAVSQEGRAISLPRIELPEVDFSKITPESEKKRLREAISALDDLGLSPEKLAERAWDFLGRKENREKAGKAVEDLRDRAGQLIEEGTRQLPGGAGDAAEKAEEKIREKAGEQIDRAADQASEQVREKLSEAADEALGQAKDAVSGR